MTARKPAATAAVATEPSIADLAAMVASLSTAVRHIADLVTPVTPVDDAKLETALVTRLAAEVASDAVANTAAADAVRVAAPDTADPDTGVKRATKLMAYWTEIIGDPTTSAHAKAFAASQREAFVATLAQHGTYSAALKAWDAGKQDRKARRAMARDAVANNVANAVRPAATKPVTVAGGKPTRVMTADELKSMGIIVRG